MDDRALRAALERRWDASDANDFKVEHEIYREGAVLDYPQSGHPLDQSAAGPAGRVPSNWQTLLHE
jgi:hypothetical protein